MKNCFRILFTFALAITFASCSNSDVLSLTDQLSADSVQLGISSFRVTDMIHSEVSATSKALTATTEETILDMYVLIFDSNGYLIGRKYVDGSPTQIVVPARISSSKCTVYCFANTHSAAFFEGIATLQQLRNKYKTYTDIADLTSETAMLMYGMKEVTSLTASNTLTAFPLNRDFAKVHVVVQSSNDIIIDGYQMMHVPLSFYVADDITTDTNTPIYPAGTVFADYDKVDLTGLQTSQEIRYYIPCNYAGDGTVNSTSMETRFKKFAPADASYLRVWVHGNTWKSFIDIYMGGKTSNDYQNYNIYRNFDYEYTLVSVAGSGNNDLRVTVENLPKVGDYYYSDGTYSTKLNSSKTVVGVVFENDPTRMTLEEREAGFFHGYVIALHDAGTVDYQWATSTAVSTDITGLTNVTNCQQGYYDISSGYKGTFTLGLGTNANYPGFVAAHSYNKDVAPAKSTGWYLPSTGQWWSVQEKLGLCSSLSGYHERADLTHFNLGIATVEADQVLNVLNNYMKQIRAVYGNAEATLFDSSWYMSASERSYYQNCAIGITGSSNVLINGAYGYTKSGTQRVRPVLAF